VQRWIAGQFAGSASTERTHQPVDEGADARGQLPVAPIKGNDSGILSGALSGRFITAR
jgi:hypothetical protein